jgi:hypothetical protein
MEYECKKRKKMVSFRFEPFYRYGIFGISEQFTVAYPQEDFLFIIVFEQFFKFLKS